MAKIIDIDSARPHVTALISCGKCGYKWQAVFPDTTNGLECPSCHQMVNECGTPVLVMYCKTCGRKFSVCPVPENKEDWEHCLATDCHSYDESRDADKLFDARLVKRDDDDKD